MGFEVDIEVSLDTNPIPFTIYRKFDNFDDACGYRHRIMNSLREAIEQEQKLYNFDDQYIVKVKHIVKIRSKLIDLSIPKEIL